MAPKGACKSSSNYNLSLCLKQLFKKKSVRQSILPSEPSTAMNDKDVSNEEVTLTVCVPKMKVQKSASGDRDVPPMKKPLKSKVMNKKELDSLKASISLDPSVLHRVIADKFKTEQTLSEKLKRFTCSLLGKESY